MAGRPPESRAIQGARGTRLLGKDFWAEAFGLFHETVASVWRLRLETETSGEVYGLGLETLSWGLETWSWDLVLRLGLETWS